MEIYQVMREGARVQKFYSKLYDILKELESTPEEYFGEDSIPFDEESETFIGKIKAEFLKDIIETYSNHFEDILM